LPDTVITAVLLFIEKKLPAGLQKAIAKKQGSKDEDDDKEEVDEAKPDLVSYPIPDELFQRGEHLHLAFCGYNGTTLKFLAWKEDELEDLHSFVPLRLSSTRPSMYEGEGMGPHKQRRWCNTVGEVHSSSMASSGKFLLQCGRHSHVIDRSKGKDLVAYLYQVALSNQYGHGNKEPLKKDFQDDLLEHCEMYHSNDYGSLVISKPRFEWDYHLPFDSLVITAPYAKRLECGWEQDNDDGSMKTEQRTNVILKQIKVLSYDTLIRSLSIGCKSLQKFH
jgi:hypothetical protein